ncbi:MAG: hypothetical protein MMC33_005361 [Icmadophila ericetorum]|nr:hypothetical protein [Icmadophila ericetorum]
MSPVVRHASPPAVPLSVPHTLDAASRKFLEELIKESEYRILKKLQSRMQVEMSKTNANTFKALREEIRNPGGKNNRFGVLGFMEDIPFFEPARPLAPSVPTAVAPPAPAPAATSPPGPTPPTTAPAPAPFNPTAPKLTPASELSVPQTTSDDRLEQISFIDPTAAIDNPHPNANARTPSKPVSKRSHSALEDEDEDTDADDASSSTSGRKRARVEAWVLAESKIDVDFGLIEANLGDDGVDGEESGVEEVGGEADEEEKEDEYEPPEVVNLIDYDAAFPGGN